MCVFLNKQIKSANKYLAKVNLTKIVNKIRKSFGKIISILICLNVKEYVTRLEIAPNNMAIAALYISGKIAIYALPSLKLISEWFMTEQVSFNQNKFFKS